MRTDIGDYITHAASNKWQPLIENEIHYHGVFVKSLRYDSARQRSPTILLRFDPGASYPFHLHPEGEELYVLAGEVTIEGANLVQGDYLYTLPGFKHSVRSDTGGTLLLVVPQEVELVPR